MPKSYNRASRVASTVHQRLSYYLDNKVKDSRIHMVTITEVTLTQDLSFARVYFSVMKDDEATAITKHLNDAAGFLRSLLAKDLELRVVPKLKFIFDSSMQVGRHIEKLLAEENITANVQEQKKSEE